MQQSPITEALHSVFAFSSASRWFEDACPASIRMSRYCKSTTNPQAELGTAAHELGEFCLTFGFNPYECIGLVFNDHKVDDYMANNVAVYVNFIRSLMTQHNVKPMLEKRVYMTSLGRNDVYGTSDCVVMIGDVLYIIDYKNGFGVVEVKDNKQAIGYAIATLDTLNLWGIVKRIVATIVQPRASHVDGPIRSFEYSIDEMRVWQGRFARSIQLAEDINQVPVAGDHCAYCPARANCRARFERTLQYAYLDSPLHELSKREIEIIFEEIKGIKTHLDAIEGRALELGREGYKFENYKLVNLITRATCTSESEFVDAAVSAGISQDKLFTKKLVSMSAAKRAGVPAKVVNQYYEKPPASTTLARITDNRPAVRVGDAVGVFAAVGKPTPDAVGIFEKV